MQVSFRQGIIRHTQPTFVRVQGQYVDLVVGDQPIMMTMIDGSKDYLVLESKSIPNAWGPLPLGQTVWLYFDIDVRTAVRTFGFTTLAPVLSVTAPTNPAAGQHWFNLSSNRMFVADSTRAWQRVVRVFACQLSSGVLPVSVSINSPVFTGTQVGATSEAQAGYIIFDVEGNPVTSAGGGFATTIDKLRTSVQTIADVSIASIPVSATVDSAMPAYTVVQFTSFGVVSAATPFTAMQPTQFGVIISNAIAGDVVNVFTTGCITNPSWDWTSAGVNARLYVDANGQLTHLNQLADQIPIATVLDRDTIQVGSPSVVTYTTVAGAAGTTPATPLSAGIARLSTISADPSDPIVVGNNDPRMTNDRNPTPHSHALDDVAGLTTALSSKLDLTGGAVTGNITITAAPTASTHVVTKQYVDTVASTIPSLPAQTGQAGNVLSTNGSTLAWSPQSSYTLTPATSSVLGGVKVGTGLAIDGSGTLTASAAAVASSSTFGTVRIGTGLHTDVTGSLVTDTIPTATSATLGVIKVGAGLSINEDGVVVTDPVAVASTSFPGVVTVGSGLLIDGMGVLSTDTIPTASSSVSGGVKVGAGLIIDGTGTLSVDGAGSGGSSYTLPVASAELLGGIKLGTGLTVDGNGVVSTISEGSYTLPPATTSVLGGVKVGTGLSVDGSGILTTNAIPTASSGTLGVVKVGAGLAIDGFGVLSSSAAGYTLPPATTTVLGGVKVGSGLTVDINGAIALGALSPATTTTLGAVKIGTGISIDGEGSIAADAAPIATTTTAGTVIVGSGLSVTETGIVSASAYQLPTATSTILGGIKASTGLTVNVSGELSVDVATSTTPGIVSIGSGLSVDGNGEVSTIPTPIATTTTVGTVSIGAGLAITGEGVLSATGAGGGGGSITPATDTVLGGIIGTTDVYLEEDGHLWVEWSQAPYPSYASAYTAGIIKVSSGSGLSIDADGQLSVVPGGSIPVATTTSSGGVIVGSGMVISGGVIDVPAATLFNSTTGLPSSGTVLVMGDRGITIDSGDSSLVLSAATTTTMGGVKSGGDINVSSTGVVLESSMLSYRVGTVNNIVLVRSDQHRAVVASSTTGGSLAICICNINAVTSFMFGGQTMNLPGNSLGDLPFSQLLYIKNTSTSGVLTYTINIAYTGPGGEYGVTNVATTNTAMPLGTVSYSVPIDSTRIVRITALDAGSRYTIEDLGTTSDASTWIPWFQPIYTKAGVYGGNYQWVNDATAVPTSATTNGGNTTGDYATIPIPQWNILGTVYTSMYVSTQGYVTFQTPDSTSVTTIKALGQPAITLAPTSGTVALTSIKYGTYSGTFRCRMWYTHYGSSNIIVEIAIPLAATNTAYIAYWKEESNSFTTTGSVGLCDGATFRGAHPAGSGALGWGSVSPSATGSSGYTNATILQTYF